MSIYSSNRKERRSSRIHLGHLKLSIIEDSSALVVQIFEARGLLRREGGSLDAYVKLYVLPDPHKKSKQKTKIVRQKDPIFNEKFSFILNERDNDKNLFISVWTHQTTSRNEMLGCMTFKIADLVGPNKNINGWYQVLDLVRGRTENTQVPTSISKFEATISKYENAVLRGHKVFGVIIMKSQDGYGFSVYGKNPIYITKVIPGLPAANVDLRDGDVILEVEGTDVRRVTGHQVVEIVRNCQLTVHMVVERAHRSHIRPRSHTQKSHPNHLLHPFNSLSRNRSKSHMSVATNEQSVASGVEMDVLQCSMPAPMTERNRYSANYSSQSYLLPEFHANPYFSKTVPSPPLSSQPRGPGGAQYNADFIAGGYGVPGLLSQPAPVMYASQGGPGIQLQASFGNRNVNEGYGLTADESGGVYMGGGVGLGHMTYGTAVVKNSTSRRGVFRNNSSANRASKEEERVAIRTDYSALSQPSEPAPELVRGGGSMRAPLHLKPPTGSRDVERVASLTQHNEGRSEGGGAVAYSPFTRTASLSPYHTSAVGYRQIHGNRMQRTSETPSTSPEPDGLSDGSESLPVDWESLTILEQKRQEAIHNLLAAEQTLVSELQVGMATYYQPLQTILPRTAHHKIFLAIPEMLQYSSTIVDLLKRRQVSYTTAVATAGNYIYAVADVYASKFPDMVSTFQSYLKNFQVARQEIALSFTNEAFTKLVQESVEEKRLPSIYAFVEGGREYLQKMCKCVMALLYHTQLSHHDHNHLPNLMDALLPLMADKDQVAKLEKDKEVMRKKQVCIGFGPKMHSFPILVPGRFLIHEGEVLVIEKKKKKRIWLMLFSDILLMTRKNGRILTCTEQPLVLEQTMVSDINCTEPTDFQVVLVEGAFIRLLRAGSVATRDDWVERLKERASGTLANRKKAGEKGHTHHYRDVLKKESRVLAATLAVDTDPELIAHNLMTPIPESVSGNTLERRAGMETEQNKMTSNTGSQIPSDLPLKRGISKRRSLFTGGSKKGDQSESCLEASGTSSKGKKNKKKGNAKSPTSKPTTPVVESLTLEMIPVETLRSWESSFSALLAHADGIRLFENYLKSEFSEENIQFWKACERFKTLPDHHIEKEAAVIYDEYIDPQASKLVNIDHQTSKDIEDSKCKPTKTMFQDAQQSIYLLMARDSFVRFIKSEPFQTALKR